MTEEEPAVAVTKLLPPGAYPIWSPHDAYETAALLLATLAEENPRFMEEKNENSTC